VIVVIGRPGDRSSSAIARAAAGAGGSTQLVTRVADDASGDRLILDLATAGVGHVATLRQPPPVSPLDAADVELALRYLADVTTVVLVDPPTGVVRIASEAAAWDRGALLVVLPAGSPVLDGLPSDAVVLEAPAIDPEDAFAAVVGDLAVRLDAGEAAEGAFASALASVPGWTPVEGDD